MAEWNNINNKNDRFKLSCDHDDCDLSIANLLYGRLHLTSIHNDTRHSYTFSHHDMLFVVSQYIKNLSPNDRKKLLEFYSGF